MKIFKTLAMVALLAVTSWAQESEISQDSAVIKSATTDSPAQQVVKKKTRPSREHRGFYFSTEFGLAYTNLKIESVREDKWSTTDDDNKPCERVYEEEFAKRFKGYALPTLDFKFGKSIGNLVAIHSVIGIEPYLGRARYRNTELEKEYGYEGIIPVLHKDSIKYQKTVEGDFTGGNIALGFGVTVYPFRNPNFVLNGLYIGVSGGMSAFFGFFDDYDESILQEAVFSRYELGKDWWVSDTWSIGFGFVYVNVTAVEESGDENRDGRSHNVFQFLIRLTRG